MTGRAKETRLSLRWSDVSGVRVRNVVYRGDWPDALPAAEEQGFAMFPNQK